MDLSSPLRSLIPSLGAVALEVLVGTESSLSLARITELASRGSRQGIATVLARLVEHGLVLAQPANQGALYELNRDHVLAPCVLAAVNARGELVRRLRNAVSDLDPAPTASALFGSYARREAGPASDIDLLLVVPDELDTGEAAWAGQIDALAREVHAWTGNRLEPLVLSVAILTAAVASREPLVESLRDDAIPLTGGEALQRILTVQAPHRARRARTKAAKA